MMPANKPGSVVVTSYKVGASVALAAEREATMAKLESAILALVGGERRANVACARVDACTCRECFEVRQLRASRPADGAESGPSRYYSRARGEVFPLRKVGGAL